MLLNREAMMNWFLKTDSMQDYTEPSLNNRMWGRTLRTETLDQNNARDCSQSCGYSGKWTSVLWARAQLHRMWAIALRNGTLDPNDAKDSVRVVRTFGETHAISAIASSTTQDGRKTEDKKILHSASFFCFVVFRPHSLLDFLESRVMKRKSINHCV